MPSWHGGQPLLPLLLAAELELLALDDGDVVEDETVLVDPEIDVELPPTGPAWTLPHPSAPPRLAAIETSDKKRRLMVPVVSRRVGAAYRARAGTHGNSPRRTYLAMTLAICLRCGTDKVGALTPCHACSYDPAGDRAQMAKALLLSDRFAGPEDLRQAAALIRAGEEVPFDPALVARLVADLAALPDPTKMPLGCTLLVWAPVVLMFALAILVVFLWTRR